MGSFLGHIFIGSLFTSVSLWWLFHTCRSYVRSKEARKPFRAQLTYFIHIRGRQVPLETLLKLLFTAIGFIAGLILFSDGWIGEDGQFHNIWAMEHNAVYAGYFISGIADLMCFFKLTSIEGLDYLSGAIAFAWHGTAFYFHSEPNTENPPLELIMHRLPVVLMFVTGFITFLEMYKRDSAALPFIRCFTVLSFGSWFAFIGTTLFKPIITVKAIANPYWDRNSIPNTSFMVTAYGIHLTVNLSIVMAALCFAESYRKLVERISGVKGRRQDTSTYEKVKLLDAEESSGFEENEL